MKLFILILACLLPVISGEKVHFRLCGEDRYTHPELKATWLPHDTNIFKSILTYSFGHVYNDHLNYVDTLHFVARDVLGNVMTNQIYTICGPGQFIACSTVIQTIQNIANNA
jgi:hypothetical protein